MGELGKPTLATSEPVLVLRHECSLAAARAVAPAPCHFVACNLVKLVHCDFPLRWNLFVSHYFLAPPAEAPPLDAAASCFAFSLAAFSSSSIFFLSSFGSVLISL